MPAALPDSPAVRQAEFSPFRRHRIARALCTHVLAELRAGRLLSEVLDDDVVREWTAEQPEVLEDLAWDQEVLAAIEDNGSTRDPSPAPSRRRGAARALFLRRDPERPLRLRGTRRQAKRARALERALR